MSRYLPLARLGLLLMPPLALAGCGGDPIRYIPQADRSLLEAQARLGEGDAPSPNAIAVADMLRKVRQQPAGAGGPGGGASGLGLGGPAHPVTVRFSGDAVQPDESQLRQIRGFATAAMGARVVVNSQASGMDAGAGALLGQRRAMAVARALAPDVPDPDIRFDPDIPAGEVILAVGGPAEGAAP